MKFDIAETGQTENIKASQCTHDILKAPSEKTLSKWRYRDSYLKDPTKPKKGATSKIVYNLQNSDGSPAYDPNLYIPKGVDPSKPEGWSLISCG